MDRIYKILGFVIPITTAVVAYMLVNKFDLRQVQTENDFITAILHSESVYMLSNQAKTMLAIGIIAIGACFGIITYGIGVVLTRLKNLAAK